MSPPGEPALRLRRVAFVSSHQGLSGSETASVALTAVLIATFNINNINRRLDNLLAWLAEARPDVVCLQELKAEQTAFPRDRIAAAGYDAVWQGQKTWNGVAILSKIGEPVVTCTSLPGDPDDVQSRYIEAAVRGMIVASIYAPNGNPQPGPRFAYKLAWLARLRKRATALRRTGAAVVLAGDFNVAPTELDIYPTKSWDDDALIQPESRAAFRSLVGRSWTDALRHLHPDERIYTFWDYKRQRWPANKGLRLDHFLLTPDLASRLIEGGVDSHARGRTGASDHAPAWIRFAG